MSRLRIVKTMHDKFGYINSIRTPIIDFAKITSRMKIKSLVRNFCDKPLDKLSADADNAAQNHNMDETAITTDDRNFSFSKECETALNNQISIELDASYKYLAMATYFGRSDVAFPGLFAFFFKMHLEEVSHTHTLVRYQLKRGGKVQLLSLTSPPTNDWTILASLKQGLKMEQYVKKHLIHLVQIAAEQKDLTLEDFIVSEFLHIQDNSIQEFCRLLQRYKEMTKGKCSCADYLFDKRLHSLFAKTTKGQDELGLGENEKVYI